MTLTEQIYAQALLLAGELEQKQMALLRVLCQGANNALASRLRDGLTPEDCKVDFVASAALLALAALSETDLVTNLQQIQIGDVTMRPGGSSAAARCLRKQAELIMAPYLDRSFLFRRV